MPCTPFRTSSGVSGFVCTRGRKPKRCSAAGCTGPGHYLCDQLLTGGRTCSAPMCGHHRTQHDGLDLCPKHARAALQLFEAPGQAAVVALSLTCSCDAIAPLPCDGRDEQGRRCTTVVCGRHAVVLERRWLCRPCARAAAPPPQPQLFGATP
jgi:hypothetical protein